MMSQKIMKVKMLKDAQGADDGIHVKDYKKGESYELSEKLANNFLEQKVAEVVEMNEEKMNAKKAEDLKAQTQKSVDEAGKEKGAKK